jgi:hypothetical protein
MQHRMNSAHMAAVGAVLHHAARIETPLVLAQRRVTGLLREMRFLRVSGMGHCATATLCSPRVLRPNLTERELEAWQPLVDFASEFECKQDDLSALVLATCQRWGGHDAASVLRVWRLPQPALQKPPQLQTRHVIMSLRRELEELRGMDDCYLWLPCDAHTRNILRYLAPLFIPAIRQV